MKRRAKIAIGGLAGVLVLGGGGATLAAVMDSSGSHDAETEITGVALERASAAALAHTGQGTVTATEIHDQEGYYEVEVTLDDGAQVDVHLDQGFQVTDSATDEGADH